MCKFINIITFIQIRSKLSNLVYSRKVRSIIITYIYIKYVVCKYNKFHMFHNHSYNIFFIITYLKLSEQKQSKC